MKKTILILVMVLMLSLVFAGIAAAAEEPNTPVSAEVEEDYVGKDMELEDGEFGITAVPEEEVDEDYVGKGVELAEGEMGITSVSDDMAEDDYVGKDMELEEGEVGIISYPGEPEEPKSKLPLYGGMLALIGVGLVGYKKILVK